MKLNIVRNILLSSAIALALCAGPTMAVASTAPHPVTAAPIIALSGVTSTVVDYTIHHIHTLDHNIHGKGTFRLTHGRGNVEAWTVHQLSTGRSYKHRLLDCGDQSAGWRADDLFPSVSPRPIADCC